MFIMSNISFFFLQKIPYQLANFLKHNICESIIVCGDNGWNQTMNIIVNHDPLLTTQIGPK